MRRRTIAFDWDDTLVDFNKGFVLFHNKHYGTKLTYEDIHSHEMSTVYGCDLATITERTAVFKGSEGYRNLQPMVGAARALRYLRQHHDLEVVTNRMEAARDQTIADATRHFENPFRQFHFANGFGWEPGFVKRLKSEVCKQINPTFFIEDAPIHAKDVAQLGIPVLMPDRPWNRDDTPSGVIRMDSWEHTVRWIDIHA